MTTKKLNHVAEHIKWLEGREIGLAEGIKRKPKARDINEAKEELRGIRAVLRKLRA